MASAQSESSVLREELTCTVCLDVFSNPYMLPCGHSFCKACIDNLKQQSEQDYLRCPECRRRYMHDIKFLKNFKIANIADDYRDRQRATTTPCAKSAEVSSSGVAGPKSRPALAGLCDFCHPGAVEAPGVNGARDASSASHDGGGEAAASGFAVKTCLKCEVSMCPEHLKPHLELLGFSDHPLIDSVNDLWKWKCPVHDEIYRYFCMDDKEFVCLACGFNGEHLGHAVKTLKSAMKDLKEVLDKHLYRVDRRTSHSNNILKAQKDKETLYIKLKEESEQCLARLGDRMKAEVLFFVARLRKLMHNHFYNNWLTVQSNIFRIHKYQFCLLEARHGIETLMQETNPLCFINAYETNGKQYCRQVKHMFFPEYVNTNVDLIVTAVEEEMKKHLYEELSAHILTVTNSLGHLLELEEVAQDDCDYTVDFDDDDSSEEEITSEEDEEEEEEEEENHPLSDGVNYVLSPGVEEEEEEEEDDDDNEDDDNDDVESEEGNEEREEEEED